MVKPMAYLSILDGVRTIAVCLVVLSHIILPLTDGKDLPFYNFHTMGHVGVMIFFVHTTLVLMASLQRHGSSAIPFYVRRFFRIYPLSAAIVLFIALMQLLLGQPINMGKFLSSLFLVQNITGYDSSIQPLWSLPYEVQMYLVLPLLYMVTQSRKPVLWIGILCAASMGVVLALDVGSLGFKLLRFVPCFVPGALAFVLAHRLKQAVSPAVLFGVILVFGVGGIPMLVALGCPQMPLMWALCIALAVTIPISREIESRAVASGFKLVAKYSYGVYLTHVFAIGAIEGLMPGPLVVQWAAMLVLLPGLAYIAYHGIEKYGIALGARLADQLSERQNLRAAASSDQAGSL